MTKEEELELLDKELKYWELEYHEKMSDSKRKSIELEVAALKRHLIESHCNIIIDSPLEIVAIKSEVSLSVKSDFDFIAEPKKPRQLKIESVNKETKSNLTIRLMQDEDSLPQPDLNRLKINPYEGMSSLEVEIFERKKSVNYMKTFINETEHNHWNYWCLDDSGNQSLYKSITELYREKVHNML